MDDILNFWFDGDKFQKFWFKSTDQIDTQIKTRFGELLQKAENYQLEEWKQTNNGVLALIIILDQFSRHIYRGTPNSYKNDKIALEIAREFTGKIDFWKMKTMDFPFIGGRIKTDLLTENINNGAIKRSLCLAMCSCL